MRTRTAVLSAALAPVLALGACGEDESSPRTLELDAPASSPTEPATTEPTTAVDPGEIPEDPVDGQVIRGTSVAKGAQKLAVEDVYYDFWTERLRMFRTTEVDRDYWYTLATGDAAQGPLDFVEGLRERGTRIEGGVIIAINELSIKNGEATVESCIRNSTVEVDGTTGRASEAPRFVLRTRETLVKEGPDWRVTETANITGESCEYR